MKLAHELKIGMWLTTITLMLTFSMSYGETRPDSLVLSVDSCKAMALRASVPIKIAQKTIEKSQAEKSGAQSHYFPKISATASTLYMFDNIDILTSIAPLVPSLHIDGGLPSSMMPSINNSLKIIRENIIAQWRPIELSLKGAFLAGVTLQQPVYVGGQIVAGNKMAQIGTEMANQNLKLKQSEAIVEAEKGYWLYISVQEKVRLAQSYLTLLNQVEQQVRYGNEVAMIDQNTLLQVQMKQSDVKMSLQRAESGLELSRMALCQIIGVPLQTQIIASDSMVSINKTLLPTTDSTIENRTEYQLLKENVALKHSAVNMERGKFLPSVALAATYGYLGNIAISGIKDPAYNISHVMAILKIPLSDWWEGSQKIKSAKRDEQIAQLEFENKCELMQLQLQQIILNIRDSYIQIGICQQGLKAATENLRVCQDKYEVKMETVTNLLQAQSNWQEANSKLIDAKIAYRLAEIEYQKVNGQL